MSRARANRAARAKSRKQTADDAVETATTPRRGRANQPAATTETRLQAMKRNGKKVGIVTGAVVMALAAIGATTLLVRKVVAGRRPRGIRMLVPLLH